MNTYEYEYESEDESEDEDEIYDDPDGYIVFDIADNIGYYFRTYTEMRDSFGESVIWDHENEMYIVQQEEEEDDELAAFFDNHYFINEL